MIEDWKNTFKTGKQFLHPDSVGQKKKKRSQKKINKPTSHFNSLKARVIIRVTRAGVPTPTKCVWI